MCGIFGMYSGSPLGRQHRDSLIEVANSQVVRGHHAFGLAWQRADGGIDSYKRSGAVSDHPTDVMRGIGSRAIIGHTRWATHGDAGSNLNNHPHGFEIKGCRGYLVHNGIIGNYEEIAMSRGLVLKSQCDSEVLARHIEDNNGTALSRVVSAIADVDRSAPLAVAVLVRDGLILARRGNPLFWSDDKDIAWFASTQTALRGRVYEVPDNTAFLIPAGKGEVTKMPLAARQYSNRRWLGSDMFA